MPADRRTFVKALGAATLALGATPGADTAPAPAQKPSDPVRFGVDMCSLGAQKWNPSSRWSSRRSGMSRWCTSASAKLVRSPIVRAVLGSSADRRGGIEKHIDSTVSVLKNSR